MSSVFCAKMDITTRPIWNNNSGMAKNYIKEIRLKRGLTQEDLAEKMDITHPTVQRHENGKRRLDIDWIRRYADALEVHPLDIMEGPSEAAAPLNEKEKQLLQNFRQMDDRDQDVFLNTGKAFTTGRDAAPEKTPAKEKRHGKRENR